MKSVVCFRERVLFCCLVAFQCFSVVFAPCLPLPLRSLPFFFSLFSLWGPARFFLLVFFPCVFCRRSTPQDCLATMCVSSSSSFCLPAPASFRRLLHSFLHSVFFFFCLSLSLSLSLFLSPFLHAGLIELASSCSLQNSLRVVGVVSCYLSRHWCMLPLTHSTALPKRRSGRNSSSKSAIVGKQNWLSRETTCLEK